MRNEKRSLELAANDRKPKHYLTCPGCNIRQGKMMNHYHSSFSCQEAIDSTYDMQLKSRVDENMNLAFQKNNQDSQVVTNLDKMEISISNQTKKSNSSDMELLNGQICNDSYSTKSNQKHTNDNVVKPGVNNMIAE